MPRGERGHELKEYQNRVVASLKTLFGERNVKKEWDVAKDSQDAFTRQLYCPRLDIAVGPFNIDGNIYHNNEAIDRALTANQNFISRLFSLSEDREDSLHEFLEHKNKNPRCLLAIEIEDSGSRKHMLGDIANASIIGSIGVIVPFNSEKLSHFKRIRKYVEFATHAGKIKTIFQNVLIISRSNFQEALNSQSNIN